MKSPKVSIIMPIYNNGCYLKESIESILIQTFSNFELIIINDGSTDNSDQVIYDFLQLDCRIRYFNYKNNLGLINRLNNAIDISKGKYIARMDGDDIAFPERLSRQVKYLEENPTIALIGTSAKVIDKESEFIGRYLCPPVSDGIIRMQSIFSTPFIHPSIMVRKRIIKNFYYSDTYPVAEDYFLWTEIINQYSVGNIPEILIAYRIHKNNSNELNKHIQLESLFKIFKQQLQKYNFPHTVEDIKVHLDIASNIKREEYKSEQLNKAGLWLEKLCIENKVFPKKPFEEIVGKVWFRYILLNIQRGKTNLLRDVAKLSVTKKLTFRSKIIVLILSLSSVFLYRIDHEKLKSYFFRFINPRL